MKAGTLELIRTALAVDDTVQPVERSSILAALKAGTLSDARQRPPSSLRAIRLQEAAKLLKVHPATVKRYLDMGMLTGIKPRERWQRVFEDSVVAMIEGRRVLPKKTA